MLEYPYAFRHNNFRPSYRIIAQQAKLPNVYSWNNDVGHNPHPRTVKHFYGLHNMPICHVFDPPTNQKRKSLSALMEKDSFVNPINTLTGSINWKVNRNSNMEKEISMECIPFDDSWRRELRALTESIIFKIPDGIDTSQDHLKNTMDNHFETMSRPNTSFLLNSNRPKTYQDFLIGGEKRPFSRQKISKSRLRFSNYLHDESQTDEYECQIFSLLCQILQSCDVTFVKNWLTTANDREKAIVMNLIKTTFESKVKENTTTKAENESEKIKFDDYYSNETMMRTKNHERLILTPDCHRKPLTPASRITPSHCRLRTSYNLKLDKDNESNFRPETPSAIVRYKRAMTLKPEVSKNHLILD